MSDTAPQKQILSGTSLSDGFQKDPLFCRQRQFVYPMLGCILLFALFYGLFFANGYVGSDAARYFDRAHEIAIGNWEGLAAKTNDVATCRLGLILPAALALRLSDFDPVTASLYFLFFHIGTVFLVYAIGSLLHNREAGLIAAALVAAWPSIVLYAAVPLPDPACFLFLCVSFYALILGQKNIDRIPTFIWFTICGLFMGLAVTCKQTALFAFPVFFLATYFSHKGLTRKQRLLHSACFVLGLALILGIFTTILNELLGQGLVWVTAGNDQATPTDAFGDNPGNPIKRIQHFLMIIKREHGIWRFFLLAPFAYAFIFRSRCQLTMTVTAIWMFTYHLFGTVSLSNYTTAPIQTRYFLFFTLFSAICSGAIIERLGQWVAKRQRSKTIAIITIFFLLAGGAVLLKDSSTILNKRSGTLYRTASQRGLAAAIQQALYFAPEKDNPIYVLSINRTDLNPNFYFESNHQIVWNKRYLDIDEFNKISEKGFFIIIPAYDYQRYFTSSLSIDENLTYRKNGNYDLLAEIYLAKSGLNKDICIHDFGPIPLAGKRTELWIKALGGQALRGNSKTSYASRNSVILFYLEKISSAGELIYQDIQKEGPL